MTWFPIFTPSPIHPFLLHSHHPPYTTTLLFPSVFLTIHRKTWDPLFSLFSHKPRCASLSSRTLLLPRPPTPVLRDRMRCFPFLIAFLALFVCAFLLLFIA